MLTRDEVIRLAESIQGWCFREELEWLYDRAAQLPPGSTWVEVGTWKGRSLCPVLFAVPDTCTAIAVDNFEGHPMSPTDFEAGLPGWIRGHVDCLQRLARTIRKRNILEVYPTGSLRFLEVCWANLKSTVDVVYLDRDYRDEESIRKDIEGWTGILKPGGMLCGRNHTISDAPFVTDAVNELLLDHQRGPGSIWHWRKPS